MDKTNKQILEEIIRVDHAGERGAIKIYEGQLLALKTFKQNESLKKKIEEMKEHEKEHYEYFDNEIKKKYQANKIITVVGYNGRYIRIWHCYARRESCYAMYCISRGSYRWTL